jgi:hypothetical protein
VPGTNGTTELDHEGTRQNAILAKKTRYHLSFALTGEAGKEFLIPFSGRTNDDWANQSESGHSGE